MSTPRDKTLTLLKFSNDLFFLSLPSIWGEIMLMIMWGLLFYDAIKPLAHIYKKNKQRKWSSIGNWCIHWCNTPTNSSFFVCLLVCCNKNTFLYFLLAGPNSFNCIISLASVKYSKQNQKRKQGNLCNPYYLKIKK